MLLCAECLEKADLGSIASQLPKRGQGICAQCGEIRDVVEAPRSLIKKDK